MENTLLNLIPAAYLPEIHLSQYDVGRTITFTLKDGASDYSVPSGASVTVKATKPSGLGFEVACTFNGGTVTLVTTETMTPENGRFPAELSIVSGNTVIGTSNFIFNIERSPHPEGTIDGDSESLLPELTLLVERIEAAASSVLDMQVVANTLPAGSQATYSYDESLNKATFGIPQGEPGSGAVGTVASAYDASKTYAVGDYAIHNNNLYRCITAITTAEAFTASHWTKIVLADDVTDLKNDLGVLDTIVTKGETMDEDVNYTLIEAKAINGNRDIVDGWLPYYITEPISVSVGEKYKLTANVNWGNMLYVFYDSNNTAFGGLTSEYTDAGTTITDELITIPSNAVSMRLGAYINASHPFSFKKIISPNIADKLSTKLSIEVNGKIGELESIVTKGEKAFVDYEVNLTQSKAINGNRDVIDGDPQYYISDVISVEEGEKYKLTASMNWNNFLYVFYDSNNIAFGGVKSENSGTWTTLTDEVITIPSNAVGMRLGVYLDSVRGYSLEKETPIVVADKLSKEATQKWKGKRWLIVGDSLSEINATADKKYHDIIAEQTGIQVLNYAKGGTGYCRTYSTSENFCDRVLTLANVDCDVITIVGSMNDIHSELEVGTADDTGTTTLAGYINTTLDNLYSVKPFVQVGIILPVPNWGLTPIGGSENANKAVNYCNVLKEIAEKRSIPVCDLFHNSNLHPNEENFRNEYFYQADGVHPNNKGHAKFAPMVLNFLEQVIELG